MTASLRALGPGRQGFTLLEVLVVITIIAVILGFAVLTFDTEPDELDNEARRLAALIELVSEEAVMNSREYRLLIGADSYSFQVFANGEWQQPAGDLFRRRRLAAGFTMKATIEDQPPAAIASREPDDSPLSEIFILSSDEITPFELAISGPSGLRRTIDNLAGDIAISPGNP